ncbi:MAG: SH3 domain-containing protein, partial [Candidatus Omnitrophota bacterium]
PSDSDLLSNYRHAKSLLKRQDAPEKRLWPLKWLDRVMAYLTLRQAAILASVLYYSIVLLLIATKVFQKFRAYSTLMIFFLSLALVIVLMPLYHKIRDLREGGIIVSRITDGRFEPFEDATVHFPLYEGMKVYILRTKGDWCKIKRPDGKIGWVEKGAVELIGM